MVIKHKYLINDNSVVFFLMIKLNYVIIFQFVNSYKSEEEWLLLCRLLFFCHWQKLLNYSTKKWLSNQWVNRSPLPQSPFNSWIHASFFPNWRIHAQKNCISRSRVNTCICSIFNQFNLITYEFFCWLSKDRAGYKSYTV